MFKFFCKDRADFERQVIQPGFKYAGACDATVFPCIAITLMVTRCDVVHVITINADDLEKMGFKRNSTTD